MSTIEPEVTYGEKYVDLHYLCPSCNLQHHRQFPSAREWWDKIKAEIQRLRTTGQCPICRMPPPEK